MRIRRLAIAATLAAVFALPAPAGAATVTVGSPLQGLNATSQCSANPCNLIQTALPQPGVNVVSPVTGAVIRWHMLGGSGGGFLYKIQVLTHGAGLAYTATGSSAFAAPTGPGLQTFQTAVPIQAGQSVAIALQAGAPLAFTARPGASYDLFAPPLADGATGTAEAGTAYELGYNAEILPAPAAATTVPASGSIKGGTPVAIGGSNFAEVKGVSFGAVAAPFTVNSESLITAVAPAGTAPTTVPVTVTTVAGTATSQAFKYTACVVPKLGGKKLKGAKKRIRKGGCKVGAVKRPKSVSAKTGVVVKQNPKPGKILAPGAKVNVKLGT